jgi:protocatechuate 3,4-dioxygenase beta subunit
MIRRTLPWAAAFLIAGAGAAWCANTGKITGRVTDVQTGEGLYGARVELVGATMGALADEGGYYHIINLAPGAYALRARMIGYGTLTMVDIRVNPGLTTKADFKLRVAPIQGQEVTVTAERRWWSRT